MQTQLVMAITIIYVLVGVIGFSLLVLFAMKTRNILADHRTKRCLEKFHDYFIYLQSHIEDEERLKTPPGSITLAERKVIQKKLAELIERFTGTHREKLLLLCEDLGLVKLDMQRLHGWWKWTRVDAAYNLGTMRSREAVPDLLSLLRQSGYDPSVFIIARAIAKCSQEVDELREMALLLCRYKKNVHQLIADILSESQIDPVLLHTSFLQEENNELIKIGLIGLSVHTLPKQDKTLYALVESTDKEVRIKAVKLICRDSRYMTPEIVSRLMSHPDWEIRAIMAKAIGELGLYSYLLLLKDAIGDANWWVSSNSARSLARLGVEGFQVLCEIVETEGQGVKREIAAQVIAEDLEKGAKSQADIVQQLHHNEKLLAYQKLNRRNVRDRMIERKRSHPVL